MTNEEARCKIRTLLEIGGSDGFDYKEMESLKMAIDALELVDNFEKAQIITGGRLNGRTNAYKCGLADGKRLAISERKRGKNMSLDEAIRYYQEEADDHEINAEMYKAIIEEDRQLVEWLRELKAYRSLRFSIGETLVDESKAHISSEKAIEKIRNKMVDFDSETRR